MLPRSILWPLEILTVRDCVARFSVFLFLSRHSIRCNVCINSCLLFPSILNGARYPATAGDEPTSNGQYSVPSLAGGTFDARAKLHLCKRLDFVYGDVAATCCGNVVVMHTGTHLPLHTGLPSYPPVLLSQTNYLVSGLYR